MVCIAESLRESTEMIQIKELKIVNTWMKIDNKKKIEIFSLHRSHGIPKTDLISNIEEFQKKQNTKNHLVIGDLILRF